MLIGEEFGFVGGVALIGLLLLIVLGGMVMAVRWTTVWPAGGTRHRHQLLHVRVRQHRDGDGRDPGRRRAPAAGLAWRLGDDYRDAGFWDSHVGLCASRRGVARSAGRRSSALRRSARSRGSCYRAASWERNLSVSPALLRAYRRTSYVAAGAMVRIGRRSAAIDARLRGMAAPAGGFVTACNPLSRRMPDGWNRRMQRALIAHTRRLPSLTGRGAGNGWFEEHLFVAADPRRLSVLARRFHQLGIVVVGRGRPARLVLLSWPGHAASESRQNRLQRTDEIHAAREMDRHAAQERLAMTGATGWLQCKTVMLYPV